jgi:hypothetical protein
LSGELIALSRDWDPTDVVFLLNVEFCVKTFDISFNWF